jgi:hypothetical protein
MVKHRNKTLHLLVGLNADQYAEMRGQLGMPLTVWPYEHHENSCLRYQTLRS